MASLHQTGVRLRAKKVGSLMSLSIVKIHYCKPVNVASYRGSVSVMYVDKITALKQHYKDRWKRVAAEDNNTSHGG